VTVTARSVELRAVAQAIADALPPSIDEVVLTGSVSRGVADDVSDIEMLIVTPEQPELEECFALAAGCGLTELGTWGAQGGPTKRVSGRRDGVPLELVWSSRATVETALAAVFAGTLSGIADALANGLALRTSGLLAGWQARLRDYPDALAQSEIEDACLTWGGFAAAGLLTIVRPGERPALVERLVDDASRVVRIVYAVNRVWPPTLKRLAARAEQLPVKPERLAERIDTALSEPDPRRAVLVMTQLQADTVALAPDGANVVRARKWLADALEILER
jgi:hypothetical protein